MKSKYIILTLLLLAGATFLSGCNSQEEAKMGDTIKVNYTLKLEDGSVFETTAGHEPVEFKLGDGGLIPGFENAVLGMKVGDIKIVKVPFDAAYGPHHEEKVIEVPFDDLPDNFNPEVGEILQQKQDDGTTITAVITEVKENSVVLDANDPLAGKDLTFEIELLEISRN